MTVKLAELPVDRYTVSVSVDTRRVCNPGIYSRSFRLWNYLDFDHYQSHGWCHTWSRFLITPLVYLQCILKKCPNIEFYLFNFKSWKFSISCTAIRLLRVIIRWQFPVLMKTFWKYFYIELKKTGNRNISLQ